MMVRLINFCADDGCGHSVFVCDRMAGIMFELLAEWLKLMIVRPGRSVCAFYRMAASVHTCMDGTTPSLLNLHNSLDTVEEFLIDLTCM